jgi:subtilase family serine protease
MNRSKWITRFGAGMLGIGLTAAALFNSAAPANAHSPVQFDQSIITAPAPDLRAQNISVMATPDTVTINFQVRNAGSAAAGGFWSMVQVDGVNVAPRFTAGLAVGAVQNHQVSFPNPNGLAIHTVTAIADSSDMISELLEGNNSASLGNQKW